MAMTRKQRRAGLIGVSLAVLGAAAGLVLYALNDTMVFFYTPSDLTTKKVQAGQRFRLGGLVAEGSVKKNGTQVEFSVTDKIKDLKVSYNGILPDLFREGQGVIAEGKLGPAGAFIADNVLAKHDETYMPPEVKKALEQKGVWQGQPTKAAAKK